MLYSTVIVTLDSKGTLRMFGLTHLKSKINQNALLRRATTINAQERAAALTQPDQSEFCGAGLIKLCQVRGITQSVGSEIISLDYILREGVILITGKSHQVTIKGMRLE